MRRGRHRQLSRFLQRRRVPLMRCTASVTRPPPPGRCGGRCPQRAALTSLGDRRPALTLRLSAVESGQRPRWRREANWGRDWRAQIVLGHHSGKQGALAVGSVGEHLGLPGQDSRPSMWRMAQPNGPVVHRRGGRPEAHHGRGAAGAADAGREAALREADVPLTWDELGKPTVTRRGHTCPSATPAVGGMCNGGRAGRRGRGGGTLGAGEIHAPGMQRAGDGVHTLRG